MNAIVVWFSSLKYVISLVFFTQIYKFIIAPSVMSNVLVRKPYIPYPFGVFQVGNSSSGGNNFGNGSKPPMLAIIVTVLIIAGIAAVLIFQDTISKFHNRSNAMLSEGQQSKLYYDRN